MAGQSNRSAKSTCEKLHNMFAAVAPYQGNASAALFLRARMLKALVFSNILCFSPRLFSEKRAPTWSV